jgi:hypothetical protein
MTTAGLLRIVGGLLVFGRLFQSPPTVRRRPRKRTASPWYIQAAL